MSEFTDHLVGFFGGFGALRVHRMFGGYGLYHAGIMFALVADGTFYLKADTKTASAFTSRGLVPFEYLKGEQRVKLSYFQAPEEALEDPDAATDWARIAYTAAVRSKTPRSSPA